MARLAAGEVHEVGVRDARDGHRVIGRRPVMDEDRHRNGPEGGEVSLALGGPALKDGFAVGPRSCRHDRDARPAAAGGRKQRSVHLVHGWSELARADERDDAVHGG